MITGVALLTLLLSGRSSIALDRTKEPGCKVEPAYHQGGSSNAPGGAIFGPDGGRPLNLQRSMKITIHAGHFAWFTPSRSSPPPDFEQAGMLYASSTEPYTRVLTNKGQQWGTNWHARSFDPIKYPKVPLTTGETILYFSPWNKTDMQALWRPSAPKLLPDYGGTADTWLIGSEDQDPPDRGNYRDFMLLVVCY